MEIIRDYSKVTAPFRGAAVGMGNFDGVHLGHQSVIALARLAAAEKSAPLGVITFEPHPRRFFAPDAPPFRLMNAETRAHRLEKLEVDILFELPFNAALSSLSAEEFARDVLAEGLGITHVVIGGDFRFGKGRQGDPDMLEQFGEQFGFGVTVAPLISDEQGDFSSSAIREALSEGKPGEAHRILGHWHRVDGIVTGGERRGRDMGYPTINVTIEGLHPPKFGVYAVMVDVLTGPHQGTYKGAANIGTRPTFGDNEPNLEVFLFDFDNDLYGEDISIALVEYQRPEMKFDTVEALVEQMNRDVAITREILARHE